MISPWVAGGIAWACLAVGFTLGILWAGLFPQCDDGEQQSCCGGQCKRPGVEP